MADMSKARALGTDPLSGKTIYAVAEPGGALERIADETAVEAATALGAVVGAVLESGVATEAELGAFVPALYEALGEVVDVAARIIDRFPVGDGSAALSLRDVLVLQSHFVI
ncbi:hypothetical protein ABZT45_02570 [Streptomyces sp. NPDC005356]|uniref:hypothetical protein n=1 Tax=Streptomyces sp. NPDC005356 TaxID=3157167 RepID=UPI0033B7A6F1